MNITISSSQLPILELHHLLSKFVTVKIAVILFRYVMMLWLTDQQLLQGMVNCIEMGYQWLIALARSVLASKH